MPKWKKRNWIEAAAALIALIVLLSLTLPPFLAAQKAASKRRVEQTLDQLAALFAEMPLDASHASRYALNFRNEPVTRFVQRESIATSSNKPIEVKFTWSRYWLLLDRVTDHHPSVTQPDVQEEVNYFLDVYDDSIFVVYAWMGASHGEMSIIYLNNEPVFRPKLNHFDYYEAELIAPRYGGENGWDQPGVVYRDSFQAGWRKRPAFLTASEPPQPDRSD